MTTAADARPSPPRRVVVIARVLLGLSFVALAAVVLSPGTGLQDDAVRRTGELLAVRGVPLPWVAVDRLEIVANVALVVPVGVLGCLAFPRLRWQEWTAYAFIGATAVELVQGILLPNREMSATDVVANTLGALIGALVAAASHIFFGSRKV